jgi:hypothetical protein
MAPLAAKDGGGGMLYGSSQLTRRTYWYAQLALACGTALEWCVFVSFRSRFWGGER